MAGWEPRGSVQDPGRRFTASTVSCDVGGLSRLRGRLDRTSEAFEQHHVAFVSVTQHFHSGTSTGRLVLNVLLSFAQFERELIA
jgi:hypothetical protein